MHTKYTLCRSTYTAYPLANPPRLIAPPTRLTEHLTQTNAPLMATRRMAAALFVGGGDCAICQCFLCALGLSDTRQRR